MTQQQERLEAVRGGTEVVVGRLFAEMLGVDDLPRSASLFDLGLDSVSVTVACARLEQMTGVRVRFSQLFRTPTVAELAAWIDESGGGLGDVGEGSGESGADRAAELVAITPMQAETVPMGIVVEIAWWFDGEVDDAALEAAAGDVHRRHEALHARYLSGRELGLAEVPADPGRVEFHRLGREGDDAAAADVFWRVLRRPLRLGEGEVWRCAIVRSESGRTLFGLVVDHAAFDGRSWDILTAELPLAYAARVAGAAPRWTGRTASLAEMAADARQQLTVADAEAQRSYWRDELRGLPACHLPGRVEVPVVTGARWSSAGPAAVSSFSLKNAQLQVWDDYARATGMSPSVGVAAAYVQAIIRAGGTPDFGLMVPIANRAGEVIDRTITNRVCDIVLRPNGPSRSGEHILARMRDSYHRAMAARDVLVDPKELGSILSGADSTGMIRLDRMVALNYNSVPMLSLGAVAGTLAPGMSSASRSAFGVMLQVVPDPEGFSMDMLTRTDMYKPELADQLRQHFLDIIAAGPERLETETR
jgi:aryl carrier-like protein